MENKSNTSSRRQSKLTKPCKTINPINPINHLMLSNNNYFVDNSDSETDSKLHENNDGKDVVHELNVDVRPVDTPNRRRAVKLNTEFVKNAMPIFGKDLPMGYPLNKELKDGELNNNEVSNINCDV